MSKKRKFKKRIVWKAEPEKSDFKHDHLIPKEKGEELLIHKTFKK